MYSKTMSTRYIEVIEINIAIFKCSMLVMSSFHISKVWFKWWHSLGDIINKPFSLDKAPDLISLTNILAATGSHLNFLGFHLQQGQAPGKFDGRWVSFSIYVVVNFFYLWYNFYFSFVSTSWAYITIPKNKRKTKFTWDKKLTTTYTYHFS